MEIQRIKITEQDRIIVSEFMREEYPMEIDFNWLMPVIEKIESLKIKGQYIGIDWGMDNGVHYAGFYYKYDYDYECLGKVGIGETRIQAAWKAVVEFIKWYNEQDK